MTSTALVTRKDATACQLCDGKGCVYYYDEELKDQSTRECTCMYEKRMEARMGPKLWAVKANRETPLYPTSNPTIDFTKKDLFIKVRWEDFLPHLKWPIFCKGPTFRFAVVTDERIKNVYVGNEQYRAREVAIRNDYESTNSLHDLLGEDFDLVILRLGFLGYKNVAMAGALLEGLRLREAAGLPTWIVEEPDKVFAQDHHAYSEEVANYIWDRYKVLDLTSSADREAAQSLPRGALLSQRDDDTVTEALSAFEELLEKEPKQLPPPSTAPTFTSPPERQYSSAPNMDGAILGGGLRKPYSKKRNGGGGPV